MKNIHALKTDKPSTICKINNVLVFSKIGTITNDTKSLIRQNIYISNDEYIGLSYYLDGNLVRKGVIDDKNYWELRKDYKKIILTTDPELIKNGVQAIDDKFLEWLVNNSSCEQIGVKKYENNKYWTYEIIIPKEEPKQEQHNFLPGFIKQYDPKEGEINGEEWTVIQFLKWLELNQFKIIKDETTKKDNENWK